MTSQHDVHLDSSNPQNLDPKKIQDRYSPDGQVDPKTNIHNYIQSRLLRTLQYLFVITVTCNMAGLCSKQSTWDHKFYLLVIFFIRYGREFIITVIVITELDCFFLGKNRHKLDPFDSFLTTKRLANQRIKSHTLAIVVKYDYQIFFR